MVIDHWSTPHTTSAPWTNSTTGTSSPHDQQVPDDSLSGHDLLRIWLKSCWCIVQDLVRIVPLYSAHWPRTVTSLPRGSNPASNSNRGTCDASRSHRSVHTAGPSQIASSTHQQPSPIMAFRARSLPIKGSRFASKLITSHCSAAIAPVTPHRVPQAANTHLIVPRLIQKIIVIAQHPAGHQLVIAPCKSSSSS